VGLDGTTRLWEWSGAKQDLPTSRTHSRPLWQNMRCLFPPPPASYHGDRPDRGSDMHCLRCCTTINRSIWEMSASVAWALRVPGLISAQKTPHEDKLCSICCGKSYRLMIDHSSRNRTNVTQGTPVCFVNSNGQTGIAILACFSRSIAHRRNLHSSDFDILLP
jgi:hypothetical protein